ncbi:MAG: cobalamin B12-binding domain-containing protein [Candidatus Lokiarchaeota archaeon]|nr:cobalamin B12-binding domain-containing protein [Candidatus Harpocratesius repetitus]
MKEKLEEALIEVNYQNVHDIFQKMLSQNFTLPKILGIIRTVMESIGKKWEQERIALSQVYMAGKLIEMEIELHLKNSKNNDTIRNQKWNKKVYTCVYEDYHALGLLILNSTLRMAGFQVINLGIGLTEEELCNYVSSKQITLLLISTLMLASAKHLKNTIQSLRKINPNIKIFVGGAPFNLQTDLWERIGADGSGMSPYSIIPILDQHFQTIQSSQASTSEGL